MIKNEYIKIWIEGNIMFSEYLVEEVNLATAQRMISSRLEACQGKAYPFIANVTNVKTITKEARSAFSEGDGIKYMTACALIVGSPVNRLLGNFFLSVSKPSVPTKLFTSRDDALTWLYSFKKEKVE